MINLTIEQQQPHLPIGYMIDSELEIIKILSIGAFGQVYLARNIHDTNQLYAIKSLPHNSNDSRQLAFQQNEITLHSQLFDHPNIIRLERVVHTPGWTHAILEYGPEGDLFSAIIDQSLYYGNHALIRNVFLQLIDAVRYAHHRGIFHRDLKPENILVFDQGRTIKLADFGLATTDLVSTDFGCGSTFYFSPECCCQGSSGGYATAPNDVWALGIVLINLSAGRNPWKLASLQDDTFRAFLQDPKLLLKILPISLELHKILKRIFCLDPQRRMTLNELYDRIERCSYFTRTAEVDQYEAMEAVIKKKKKQLHHIQIVPPPVAVNNNKKTSNNVINMPPSPPDTPSTDYCYSAEEEEDVLSTPTSSSSLLIQNSVAAALIGGTVNNAYYISSPPSKKGDNLDSERQQQQQQQQILSFMI